VGLSAKDRELILFGFPEGWHETVAVNRSDAIYIFMGFLQEALQNRLKRNNEYYSKASSNIYYQKFHGSTAVGGSVFKELAC
jgi:hypothetical protein